MEKNVFVSVQNLAMTSVKDGEKFYMQHVFLSLACPPWKYKKPGWKMFKSR